MNFSASRPFGFEVSKLYSLLRAVYFPVSRPDTFIFLNLQFLLFLKGKKGNLSREKKNSRLFVHSLFDYIFPADLVFSFKLHQKSYTDIEHRDLLAHVVVCSYVNVVWTPLNHVTKLASS